MEGKSNSCLTELGKWTKSALMFDIFMEKIVGAASHIDVGIVRDVDMLIEPIISTCWRKRIKACLKCTGGKEQPLRSGEWADNPC